MAYPSETSCDRWNSLRLVSLISLLGLNLGTTVAQAQVGEDNTLPAGENTVVDPNGPVFEITGGATRDANLFHSFEQFSLEAGQEAFFNHAEGIYTILGRVTGGSASDIDGLIRTPDFSTADIFLINPQGVIFGPNATLDVGGSFIVSTAERITFADGTAFSTNDTQTVSLTVSQPVGLGLGQSSLNIRNEAFLEVPTGETLALVGNGIEFAGDGGEFELFTDVVIPENRLFAPAGRVALVSVAPGSSVDLLQSSPEGLGWMLDLDTIENVDLRDIELSNSAVIDTSSIFIDEPADIDFNNPPSVASGQVQLLGRQISVDSSLFLAGNLGPSKGGGLTAVASEQFTLSGGTLILDTTLIDGGGGDIAIEVAQGNIELLDESALTAQSIGVGAGGSITLDASNVRLQEGAEVFTLTFGEGAGGDLTVNATEGTVELLDASRLLAQSEGAATGASGDLTLNTSRLTVRDGSDIATSTFSEGAAGTLTINALPTTVNASGGVIELSDNSRIQAQSETGAAGAAGDITINTSRLRVQEGSDISTSTFSEGAGGTLTVNALDGGAVGSIEVFDNSRVLAQTEGAGEAGDLTLNTSQLRLQDDSQISTSTLGEGTGGTLTINALDGASVGTIEILDESRILAQTDVVGDAGDLTLNTSQLMVQDGSRISTSTLGEGAGGTLTINALDETSVGTIEVLDNSFILAQSDAGGDAGELTLNTSQLRVQGGSQVSTTTLGAGVGGTLTINALDGASVGTIEVLDDSFILAQSDAANAAGTAGNLTLNTSQLRLQGRSQVSTSTLGGGTGGTLTINALDGASVGTIEVLDDSLIFAQSETVGEAGNLTLNTSQLRLQGDSQVSTTTFGAGTGGTLTINALDGVSVGSIELSDESRILAQSDAVGAAGAAGNLILNTSQLSVQSESEISTSTLGESTGGNLTVDASTIILDGGGISSQSLLGGGGNLDLTVEDLISLEDDSLISTTAGIEGAGGDGGNITISSPDGFVIALPDENSDIIANAFEGNGGNIDITATGVFGFTEQSDLPFTELRANDSNDLSASSEFRGDPGVISVEALVIDPSQDLVELETEIVNPETLISTSCLAVARREEGRYVFTGSGGLPPTPSDSIASIYDTGDVQLLPTSVATAIPDDGWQHGDPIVEPDSVTRLADGRIAFRNHCEDGAP